MNPGMAKNLSNVESMKMAMAQMITVYQGRQKEVATQQKDVQGSSPAGPGQASGSGSMQQG